jgi:hypothetical protein
MAPAMLSSCRVLLKAYDARPRDVGGGITENAGRWFGVRACDRRRYVHSAEMRAPASSALGLSIEICRFLGWPGM